MGSTRNKVHGPIGVRNIESLHQQISALNISTRQEQLLRIHAQEESNYHEQKCRKLEKQAAQQQEMIGQLENIIRLAVKRDASVFTPAIENATHQAAIERAMSVSSLQSTVRVSKTLVRFLTHPSLEKLRGEQLHLAKQELITMV